jgi:hypothetical protein
MPRFNVYQSLVGKEDYNVWKLYRRTILTLCTLEEITKEDIATFVREYPTDDWNKSINYVKEWIILG